MTLLGLLLLLIVGAICGAIAEALVGWSPGGFLASAGLGFLGALLGTWLARVLALPSLFAIRIETATIEPVWAVLGAVVLLALMSAVRRRRYSRVWRD
jgi:uncharacterized membrane protein YeaQ/YmgE (transglycosylase-associated protein family)